MNPMIWTFVIQFLMDRAEKGFPILKNFFERRKAEATTRIVEMIMASPDPVMVAAAPVELKDKIINKLREIQATAPAGIKAMIAIFLRIVPYIADSIWDGLFEQATLGDMAKDFPTLGKAMGMTMPADKFEAHLAGTDAALVKAGPDSEKEVEEMAINDALEACFT
jgi:hypothetical protein